MKTITIVFRGLMVLHKHLDTMEIGFVDALYNPAEEHAQTGPVTNHADHPVGHPANHSAAHVPRILTTKDGVLSAIFDLRNRPELGSVRSWTLEVEDPVGPTASLFQSSSFNRTIDGSGTSFERDFRWITDLEARDLHDRDLSLDINTRQFLLVLYVRNGEFYTRLRSPQLKRRRLRDPQEESFYGPTAAVVGCDIKVGDAGSVKLMAGGINGATVFTFVPDDGTIYEISNSPPDVPVEEPNSIDAPGHFHMYYDKLFSRPRDQFDLLMDDLAPAPDPTLCGVVYLGRRQDPL
jgi:hypothetical protein